MAEHPSRGGYALCVSPHYAWVQKVFSVVPGARGYLAKEKRREADILIRRYVASRLDEAVAAVEAARQSIAAASASSWLAAAAGLPGMPMPGAGGAAAAMQGLLPGLQELAQRLRLLSSSILYADSGWAPVSAVQAVREEEIEKLCSYDDTMIGLAEALVELARRLRDAVQRGDSGEAQSLLQEALDAAAKLQSLYDERKQWLTFATRRQGPGLGERVSSAVGSALAAARDALRRLMERLGLKPG